MSGVIETGARGSSARVHDFAGDVLAYLTVGRRLTAWLGRKATLYRIRRACCGTEDSMTHEQLAAIERKCAAGRAPAKCHKCCGNNRGGVVVRLPENQRSRVDTGPGSRVAAIRAENARRTELAYRTATAGGARG